jgi:hypothetical protein
MFQSTGQFVGGGTKPENVPETAPAETSVKL